MDGKSGKQRLDCRPAIGNASPVLGPAAAKTKREKYGRSAPINRPPLRGLQPRQNGNVKELAAPQSGFEPCLFEFGICFEFRASGFGFPAGFAPFVPEPEENPAPEDYLITLVLGASK